MELRSRERVCGVPWMSLSVSSFSFVSLFLAFVRCFDMAIDMRLVVCWNHLDGVAVQYGG